MTASATTAPSNAEAIDQLVTDAAAKLKADGSFEDAVAAAVNRAILGERARCVALAEMCHEKSGRLPPPVNAIAQQVLDQFRTLIGMRPDHCPACFDTGEVPSAAMRGPRGEPVLVPCGRCRAKAEARV